MNQFDYILVFAFTILIIATGVSFSRTGKNMKSFFAGGGNVPWWVSGLSLFMSFFSAGTFVVWGSIAYSHGMVAVGIQSTVAVSGFLIYVFIVKKWQSTGVITVAEFITHRFSLKTQKIYTYLFVVISFFTAGAFLYPVAKIVNISTGYPINYVIIFLGISILLYTSIGGFWAVLATDVLQFLILTVAVLIIVPLSFQKIGGIESFLQSAPDNFFHLMNEEYSPWFLFAFIIYHFFYIGGNWSYVQRYTSVKDKKDAGRVALLFSILYLTFPLIWMLPPMIYRLVDPGLSGASETEGAYLLMCMHTLPAGMLGLMIAGMVFATASSLNTTLNMMAAVTTNDLYKAIKPDVTDKRLMLVARVSTILFGLGAVVVALQVPSLGGIVNVVLSVAAITGVPMFAPVIWGLFSKRISGKHILSVTLSSIAINSFFKFLSPVFFGESLNRANEQALGALIPLVLLTLIEIWLTLKLNTGTQYVAYLSYRESKKMEEQKAVKSTQCINRDRNYAISVIAVSACITGCLIFIIGFFTDHGQLLTFSMGSIIILMSLWVLYTTKRISKGDKRKRRD